MWHNFRVPLFRGGWDGSSNLYSTSAGIIRSLLKLKIIIIMIIIIIIILPLRTAIYFQRLVVHQFLIGLQIRIIKFERKVESL